MVLNPSACILQLPGAARAALVCAFFAAAAFAAQPAVLTTQPAVLTTQPAVLTTQPALAAQAGKEDGSKPGNKDSKGGGKKETGKEDDKQEKDRKGGDSEEIGGGKRDDGGKKDDGDSAGGSAGDSGKDKPGTKLTIEEEYVRDHLKDYLHPTSMEFLSDGRVKLSYTFYEKNPDHEAIFTPKVDTKMQSNFRWSVNWEYNGLRFGNKGTAVLNCWFKDDVEAEMLINLGINYNNRHITAIVFANDKGGALGSNFGTQCVQYAGGAPKDSKGKVEPFLQEHDARIRVAVRGGEFEAHRDKRKQSTMAYSAKSYPSGRIGLMWGGGVAGVVRSLEITGRIDAEKMAKEMRKANK